MPSLPSWSCLKYNMWVSVLFKNDLERRRLWKRFVSFSVWVLTNYYYLLWGFEEYNYKFQQFVPMPLEDKLPSQLLIGNIKVLQKKAISSLLHKSPLPLQKLPTHHSAHLSVENKYIASFLIYTRNSPPT